MVSRHRQILFPTLVGKIRYALGWSPQPSEGTTHAKPAEPQQPHVGDFQSPSKRYRVTSLAWKLLRAAFFPSGMVFNYKVKDTRIEIATSRCSLINVMFHRPWLHHYFYGVFYISILNNTTTKYILSLAQYTRAVLILCFSI